MDETQASDDAPPSSSVIVASSAFLVSHRRHRRVCQGVEPRGSGADEVGQGTTAAVVKQTPQLAPQKASKQAIIVH